MQDEIVSRLANTLDAQLTEEEARRSERSPHPSSMDLYFQGKALLNKKWTPEYLAEARGFFERALELDPANIEAVVSLALVETVIGAGFVTDKGTAHLAVAEATSVKALSLAPNHAFAHFVLGTALISTNRAAQGIAELERALTLDRNLAWAHGQIGAAKLFMGRGAETETHVNEAFRLSPRDIWPSVGLCIWASPSCSSQQTLKHSPGSSAASKPTEIIPLRILYSPLRLRCLARWMRRGPLPRQDLRSIQALPSAASVTGHKVIT